MPGREQRGARERAMVYCLIARDVAPRVHEILRRHFRDQPEVEVIVESRTTDRRDNSDCRIEPGEPGRPPERRVADRRAVAIAVPPLELPRRARAYADSITFVERLEPAGPDLEEIDTARVISRFQAGDTESFAVLYMRYFDRVYRYLLVLLTDRNEAEDAAQQVFVNALAALPRYDRRGKPFRHWLFTVVRNEALSRLRRRDRLEPVDPAELALASEPRSYDEAAAQTVLDWVTDRELVMFVERLPLAQRQVLLLRFMLDLSHAQIAELTGRSPEQVRKLLHRALGFLRERLTALGRDPGVGRRVQWRRGVQQAWVLRARRYALHGG